MKFVLIGAGKVGTSLSTALVSRGWKCAAVVHTHSRGDPDSKVKRLLASNVIPLASLRDFDYDVIIISVKDDFIQNVVQRLTEDPAINWKGKCVLHTSGTLGLDSFSAIEKKDGAVGSLHPLASFPDKYQAARAFGIYYDFLGTPSAVRVARAIAKLLNSKIIILKSPEQKVFLHIASVFASNFVTISLLEAEKIMLEKCGIAESKDVLSPLVLSSIENFLRFNGAHSLTGPLVRGDGDVIKSHMKLLENEPVILQLYKSASRVGIELLAKDDLFRNNKRSITKLRKLLEEFS
ncbi:MAG: Rossmann-like and DUF2520 domain-containing protein [Candidatus Kryptoniota bacterium]